VIIGFLENSGLNRENTKKREFHEIFEVHPESEYLPLLNHVTHCHSRALWADLYLQVLGVRIGMSRIKGYPGWRHDVYWIESRKHEGKRRTRKKVKK